jgi:hypothetical protein
MPSRASVLKNIKVTFDKSAKIAAALKEVSTTRVMAGVPAEKGLRDPEDAGEKAGGINNAALMFIHEFGAPEANIPARPVVYPAIRSIQKEVIAGLKAIGKFALAGQVEMVDKGFHALGILAQNAMRKRITDGPFEPLKPSTIAARRARGRTGVRPLIDTGQLRRALTYVIRKVKWF